MVSDDSEKISTLQLEPRRGKRKGAENESFNNQSAQFLRHIHHEVLPETQFMEHISRVEENASQNGTRYPTAVFHAEIEVLGNEFDPRPQSISKSAKVQITQPPFQSVH